MKSFSTEERSAEFRDWLDAERDRNADLLAPHLLRYELGNILARTPDLSHEQRQMISEDLVLGLRFADGDDPFLYAPPLSCYDASYVALAKATSATLVSYDDKVLKAAKKAGIATHSP